MLSLSTPAALRPPTSFTAVITQGFLKCTQGTVGSASATTYAPWPTDLKFSEGHCIPASNGRAQCVLVCTRRWTTNNGPPCAPVDTRVHTVLPRSCMKRMQVWKWCCLWSHIGDNVEQNSFTHTSFGHGVWQWIKMESPTPAEICYMCINCRRAWFTMLRPSPAMSLISGETSNLLISVTASGSEGLPDS